MIHTTILLLLLLLCGVARTENATATLAPIEEECPPNFIRFSNRCYYFALDVWLKLPNADNTCKAMQSDLVGIETQNVYNFLVREVERRLRENPRSPFSQSAAWRKQFWTSGRRQGLGWSWTKTRIEGSPTPHLNLTQYKPLTFEAWGEGEPSKVYEQGMTVMYRKGHWGWNDFVTTDTLSFICEIEIYGQEDCREDFRKFNRSCYRLEGDMERSQNEATLHCNSLASHLLAIETEEEWQFIIRAVTEFRESRGEVLHYEQWWTGGKQTWHLSGDYFDDGEPRMLFGWDVTLSQVHTGSWFPYHPLEKTHQSYLALYYKDSRWYWLDEPRDSILHYICETPRRNDCPDGWYLFTDSCYLIPRYAIKDRHSAEVICMQKGGRLIAIDSREEMDFIKSKLNRGSLRDGAKWWTGGVPIQGTWIWSINYAQFDDTNQVLIWSPGEPNNWDDQENHITLSFRSGRWGFNDVPNLNHVTLPFICEAKRATQSEEVCTEKIGRKQITRLPRTGGTWTSLILNNTFPCTGRVNRWRYYRSNPEFSVYAGVWRPSGDHKYMLVGQVELPVTSIGPTNVPTMSITVLPGDVMGIHYSRTAEAGVIAHAVAEDRAVDQTELSDILVLELNKEDIRIGEVVDTRLHTTNRYRQCLSIHAVVTPTS